MIAALTRAGGQEPSPARIEDLLAALASHSKAPVPEVPMLLRALAAHHVRRGQYREARGYAERAMAYLDASYPDDAAAKIATLEMLQDVYTALARYADAHDAAQCALAAQIALDGEHSFEVAKATQRVGVVLARVGDQDGARAAFLSARGILESPPAAHHAESESVLATTLANLASTYRRQEDIPTARALYQEALARRVRLPGEVSHETAQLHSGLALLHCEAGDDTAALRSSRQSLEIRRRQLGHQHPDIARSLMEVGWIEARLGRLNSAMTTVLEALLILSCFDLPTVEARHHMLLAAILVERGAPEAAIIFEKASVNLFQSQRSDAGSLEREFVGAREDIYRRLASNLMTAGRLPEAQQVLAMLKESELGDATEGVLPPTTRASLTLVEKKHWAQERRLRSDARAAMLAARSTSRPADRIVAEQLPPLRAWVEDLIADVALRSPDRSDEERVAVGRFGRPNGNTVRLEYLLSTDHVQIIVTDRNTQRHHNLSFPSGELHRRILALRAAIQDRSAQYLPHARALYDLLIEPAGDVLDNGGIDRIEFSLDSALRYLPVGALHDGNAHLIERQAVIILAAARRGAAVRGPDERRQAIGFGVTRALGAHRALHGVREELTSIIGADDGQSGVVPGVIRFDEHFTADALRDALARRYGIVHIASHFALHPARQEASYLLLGDGTRCALSDLARLRFDGVELLVLSACDTATAAGQQGGRDFESLGALAIGNGARNVIATLWPIRDFTSATVMRAFYDSRYRQRLDPALALQQAQLSLLRSVGRSGGEGAVRSLIDPDFKPAADEPAAGLAHPYYWAPYILMGGG